jgi:3-dehydroquinate dehydratase / shikimate dehydrogenase
MDNASVNQGKICISLCAKTAADLAEKIERAAPLADIIEVRFDCSPPEQLDESIGVAIAAKEDILAAFRPRFEGGFREISEEERINFWNAGNEIGFWGADLEEDQIENSFYWLWDNRIVSFHNFSSTPADLEAIYARLTAIGANIIKIAVQANQITDTIPLWKLLESARAEDKKLIPIAMGEAGKWTRILGLAHGAFMTYCSLDEGGETAPGQITAEEMREVYRVKQLDAETEVYGVIAGDTSYSMSPYIQNAAFKAAGTNRVFVPLQVAVLDDFVRLMVHKETREIELNFRGFAVTNPHKQSIIEYLDEIDETARRIGAVNTVKIEGGKLYGTNTDAAGFIEPLRRGFGDIQDARVTVIGGGGAARACVYALMREGAHVEILARDISKAGSLAEEFGARPATLSADASPLKADILVNATPLGTKGKFENETPVAADQLAGVGLVYDLTYNPRQTRLLREAREAGCGAIDGLEMLIAQGARQFEIWTDAKPDERAMREAAIKRLTK